jgi:molybdate transport system permease protein
MKKRRPISRPPLIIFVGAIFGVIYIFLPLVGLLRKISFISLLSQLSDGPTLSALRLSLVTSVAATLLALILGLPLAWVLARVSFRGSYLVRAFVMLPMVLPPVVGGVALLAAYGKSSGLVGALLFDSFGVQLTFSPIGVVIAEAFVALPFLVMAVEGGLRAIDSRYEELASTMGANEITKFYRVTLRLLRPSLIAGIAVAWARALGEFGATITFAGNIQGRTQTTPLAVYLLLESDPQAAYSLSFVLLIVCVLVLISMRDRWLGSKR